MGNVLAGMGNRGAGASDRPLQSPGGCYAVNRWRSLWSELARKARIWAADTVARLDPPGLVRPWAASMLALVAAVTLRGMVARESAGLARKVRDVREKSVPS